MYPEHDDYNNLYTPEQRKRFHDMQIRQQIKDAIDFFCRHKKGTGNISSHFYVKASFDSSADPDNVALWNNATSIITADSLILESLLFF